MNYNDPGDIAHHLAELRMEHRALDEAIAHMSLQQPYVDDLQLRRLKKRKLNLRDTIERLESLLIPDLDA